MATIKPLGLIYTIKTNDAMYIHTAHTQNNTRHTYLYIKGQSEGAAEIKVTPLGESEGAAEIKVTP